MSRPVRAALMGFLVLLAACRPAPLELEGDVIGVDATGLTVVPDPSAGLGAVSALRIEARPTALLGSVHMGSRARLTLTREGDDLVAVGVEPRGSARPTGAELHDHGAHHGGVVGAAGAVHAEIVAAADTRLQIFLSDPHRTPLGVTDATGTITLDLAGGATTLTLAPAGDHLETPAASLGTEPLLASLMLVRDGQTAVMKVLLDPTGKRAGVSQVPETGCVASPRTVDGRSPRCSITFAASFTAVAVSPRGDRVVVSQSHGATSVWRLPEAVVAMGLDPLPPVAVPAGAHEPDTRVIAVGPAGKEIAVAAGNQIVIFDAATGRFRRRLDGPAGVIGTMAWSADAKRLYIASSHDRTARSLDAETGAVLQTFELPGAALAVALDASGRWAAIATGGGAIAIWDVRSDAAPRIVTPSLQPLAAMVFAPDGLVTAGTDGTLRVVDPATGNETARVGVGAALVALALSPDGRHAATADAERTIRVHDLPSCAVTDTLAWHRAGIGVLAWGAGPSIVSGDNDGVLAVWDVPARERPASGD